MFLKYGLFHHHIGLEAFLINMNIIWRHKKPYIFSLQYVFVLPKKKNISQEEN